MRPLGTPVRHLRTVGSTMTEAAAWAAADAPHGALVTAEHQTAGRGRHGRTWTDAPGASLMLSLVLRPRLRSDRLGLVGLAAGLALAEALDAFGTDAQVKWPNDVRSGGRKLAGVLAEATWAGSRPTVLVGVGLNVSPASVPPALVHQATSLTAVAVRPVERLDPLQPFLHHFQIRLEDAEQAPDRLVAAVEERLEGIGRQVRIAYPGVTRPPIEGRAVGLGPDGALRLATAEGERAVRAGEVTLAPASAPVS